MPEKVILHGQKCIFYRGVYFIEQNIDTTIEEILSDKSARENLMNFINILATN